MRIINKLKNFYPSSIFVSVVNTSFISLYVLYGIFGILVNRKYSPTGKITFIQLLGIVMIVLGILTIGIIYTYIVRIIELFVPFLFIGIFLYFEYQYKMNIKFLKRKKIIAGYFILSILFSTLYELNFDDYVTRSEINLLSTSSFFIDNQLEDQNSSLIIGNFHYYYPMEYLQEIFDLNNVYLNEYTYLIFQDNWTIVNNSIHEFNELLFDGYNDIYLLISPYDTTRGYYGVDIKEIATLQYEDIKILDNSVYFNKIAVNLRKNYYYHYISSN